MTQIYVRINISLHIMLSTWIIEIKPLPLFIYYFHYWNYYMYIVELWD